MRITSSRTRRRRGAAAVEFALVAPVLFTMVFGLFEFCRIIFIAQTLNHAAREGVRFAAVKTFQDDVEEKTTEFIRERLMGVDFMAFNREAEIRVFAADSNGVPLVPDPSPQNAPFGTYVGVTVGGEYEVLLTSLTFFTGIPETFPLSAQALMNSEAN